jgi:flavin-dependent dehydrogenase
MVSLMKISSVLDFDVAVLGAGPAGSACALALHRHTPGLSVMIAEGPPSPGPRVGETMPPIAKVMLQHLGVFEAFLDQGHREVYGTSSAWGSPRLEGKEFLSLGRGDGWHLDRARFDHFLASQTARCGVASVTGATFRHADRIGDRWHLDLGLGEPVIARFVVDATGRRAAFARRMGASFKNIDRLVGFGRFAKDGKDHDPGSVVESFEDGWWYTAGLPDGLRFFVCMTDTDIGRGLRLSDEAAWRSQIESTHHVLNFLPDRDTLGPIRVNPAGTRWTSCPAEADWLAVGDAASIFDPLSSLGITKAIRSAIYAAYTIGDLLLDKDSSSVERYRYFLREEFGSYLETRGLFYALEARWAEKKFWRRRTAIATDRASGSRSTSNHCGNGF